METTTRDVVGRALNTVLAYIAVVIFFLAEEVDKWQHR